MKLTAKDKSGKQLANTNFQIFIQGANRPVSVKTDQNGYFELDDSYNGKKLSQASPNGQQGGQLITARNGETLIISTKQKEKATASESSYSSHTK